MKSWFRKILFGLLGTSLAAGATAASARCGAGRMERWRDRLLRRIGRRLDLDAAQQDRLAALADRLREQRAALRGLGARADLQGLMAGARFDRSAAQALLHDKLHSVQAGGPGVLEALADFYDSLAPDQQQRVRSHLHRRHGWRPCHA